MATDFNRQNAFNITDRRRFLKNISVVSAAFATADLWTMSAAGQGKYVFRQLGGSARRAFGRTGVQVSILGIGGYTIGEAKTEAEGFASFIKRWMLALTSWTTHGSYHDGRSEEWMGKALKGRRDKAFLMSKVCTHGRDAKVAMQQLEESLRRFAN